jgi:hypothetical protein
MKELIGVEFLRNAKRFGYGLVRHRRRINARELTLLVWTTKKAYEQHKETEAYKSFHEYLISISTTSPTTQVLELARDGSYSKRCLLTGGWPTITMTYFDEPLSDSQHTCIRRIRGMVPYCISRYPPKFGETRGFLQSNMDNVAPSSGAPAIVYVFVDWWASPDREEHVRNSRTYTPEYPGEAISLSTMMERQLKEAGCVGNDVRHVRFNWVVEYSDLNKTLAGRSLEFVPNRKSFLSDLHSHIR